MPGPVAHSKHQTYRGSWCLRSTSSAVTGEGQSSCSSRSFCPGELQHLPGDEARGFPTERGKREQGRQLGGRADRSPSLMQITTFLSRLPDSGSFSASLEAGAEDRGCYSHTQAGFFFQTRCQMANDFDSGEQLI